LDRQITSAYAHLGSIPKYDEIFPTLVPEPRVPESNSEDVGSLLWADIVPRGPLLPQVDGIPVQTPEA
jgi:hypothetical protein